MGKAKGKRGRRGQESDDDDDYVDPIKAAMAKAAAGGGSDDEAPVVIKGLRSAQGQTANLSSQRQTAANAQFCSLGINLVQHLHQSGRYGAYG